MPARILSLSTHKPTPGPNEANLQALASLWANGRTLGQRALAILGAEPALGFGPSATPVAEVEPHTAPRGP